MVERLEGLREYVGDFVVKNMNTPQPQLGFNTEAVEPITVKELEQELWGSHNKLEELYRSFEPTEQSSLAYRALIVDIKAQLKTFLLNMKTNQLDDGLGAVEKPAFLGACIHLENYVGQTIQKVEGVRVAVKEDVASLQGAGAASAEG
jgi:hypothetical protein